MLKSKEVVSKRSLLLDLEGNPQTVFLNFEMNDSEQIDLTDYQLFKSVELKR
jgi:hypothetical protein